MPASDGRSEFIDNSKSVVRSYEKQVAALGPLKKPTIDFEQRWLNLHGIIETLDSCSFIPIPIHFHRPGHPLPRYVNIDSKVLAIRYRILVRFKWKQDRF